MKVALLTAQVPFVFGGAEELAHSLKSELIKRDIASDIVTLPFKWYPANSLKKSIQISECVDILETSGAKIDKVIALKFPAFYIEHPDKSLWLIHQFRQVYDFYDAGEKGFYETSEGISLRKEIIQKDTHTLSSFKKRFTISKNVSTRLELYNAISSNVLYPPPPHSNTFYNSSNGDFLFFPSRINPSKRQELVIEALRYADSKTKIVFAGTSPDNNYIEYLKKKAINLGVSKQITWLGEIDHNKKIKLYSECLGVIFVPSNEDLGYVTMEALLSEKPVITCNDSGGALEFIKDEEFGNIAAPDPESVGKAISRLYSNKMRASMMGKAGHNYYQSLNINWDTVIERLLYD